jgi:hypothetical protein
VHREPVYNGELTAAQWALNSAVECHLHTSSLFNTFNNLTRLAGAAKYLKIRAGQVPVRVRMRVLRKCKVALWNAQNRTKRCLERSDAIRQRIMRILDAFLKTA